MGLLSGGGFLGKVGQAFGINTSAQQKAIKRATGAQVRGIEAGVEAIRGGQAETLTALEPFQQAGLGALPGLEAGATLQGFGQNISDIFSSGALDPLIQERQRASTGALSQAGLTRSGFAASEAADIPAELAFQIEALLSGRGQQLAGIGQTAATNVAQLRQADLSNIANLLAGVGEARGAGTLGQAAQQQAGLENTLDLGTKIAGFFSDIRLKTNLKPISTVGDLVFYEWDWIDGVEDLIDEQYLTNKGFIAQEVEAVYPQYIGEVLNFKTIDYKGLLKELEKWQVH